MLTNQALYRVALGKILKTGNTDKSATRPNIFSALMQYENFIATTYGIKTRLIMAHFLAQTATESADFTTLEEDFSKYSPKRLRAVFGSRITKDEAGEFGRITPGPGGMGPTRPADVQEIANTVYYQVNGNKLADDGYRFRGRGLIQLTGRALYVAFASTGVSSGLGITATNIERDDVLDRFATPALGVITAAWYWQSRGLNSLAAKDDIYGITERVTGAKDSKMDAIIDDDADDTVAYHQRLLYLDRAKKALGFGLTV